MIVHIASIRLASSLLRHGEECHAITASRWRLLMSIPQRVTYDAGYVTSVIIINCCLSAARSDSCIDGTLLLLLARYTAITPLGQPSPATRHRRVGYHLFGHDADWHE